uniref:Uncharacterized protein n=2 Tax=Ixodes scapularis TaxID=6945 RepID=A0A1S4KSR7_IXOSC
MATFKAFSTLLKITSEATCCCPPCRKISSRFPVLALRGAAVSNEVLATTAALETLQRGGNAADASVAMAAVFQVLQPYAGGVGGDCFCLFYDASKKKVHCIDGSGRSPAALTLELLLSKGFGTSVEARSKGLLATVPGAVKCWFDTIRAFGSGKVTLIMMQLSKNQ